MRAALLRLQGLEFLGVEFDAGEERVVFRHALVQEAAYAMLLDDERKRLHARVVALMDRAFAHEDAMHPEILALHCEQAGFGERAARLWQRAAWNASLRCAYVEGRALRRARARPALGRRSLSLVQDPSSRPSTTPSDDAAHRSRPVERVELELALVRSLSATRGWPRRATPRLRWPRPGSEPRHSARSCPTTSLCSRC